VGLARTFDISQEFVGDGVTEPQLFIPCAGGIQAVMTEFDAMVVSSAAAAQIYPIILGIYPSGPTIQNGFWVTLDAAAGGAYTSGQGQWTGELAASPGRSLLIYSATVPITDTFMILHAQGYYQ